MIWYWYEEKWPERYPILRAYRTTEYSPPLTRLWARYDMAQAGLTLRITGP
jgi:hypothetical protein